MFERKLRKQAGETAAGGKRERERETGRMVGTDQADTLRVMRGKKWRNYRFGLRNWKGLRCGKAVVAVVGLVEWNMVDQESVESGETGDAPRR